MLRTLLLDVVTFHFFSFFSEHQTTAPSTSLWYGKVSGSHQPGIGVHLYYPRLHWKQQAVPYWGTIGKYSHFPSISSTVGGPCYSTQNIVLRSCVPSRFACQVNMGSACCGLCCSWVIADYTVAGLVFRIGQPCCCSDFTVKSVVNPDQSASASAQPPAPRFKSQVRVKTGSASCGLCCLSLFLF